MEKILRLGIIGLSEGNGHPYSWSAIFNGYDAEKMAACPFPAIPAYLSLQDFPEASLSHLGQVTHIWTQDTQISKSVANAAFIPNVVVNPLEMIGRVDAILLARDDAENHLSMAMPFIEAGVPIFVDKPFATKYSEAVKMLSAAQNQNSVFTCSALRFAKELLLTREDKMNMGEILYAEAVIPKYWETYAIHLIEPVMVQMPGRGNYLHTMAVKKNGIQISLIEWENFFMQLKNTGNIPERISIKWYGENSMVEKIFSDSFSCFKASLKYFVEVVRGITPNFDRTETLEIVKILEDGVRT